MGNYRLVSLTLLPRKTIDPVFIEAMKDRVVIGVGGKCEFIKYKPGLTVPITAFGEITQLTDERRAVPATSFDFAKAFYMVCLVAILERCGLKWEMTS